MGSNLQKQRSRVEHEMSHAFCADDTTMFIYASSSVNFKFKLKFNRLSLNHYNAGVTTG